MDRPPPSIGLKLSLWMVRRMYQVEVYLRVRRAVMVDGISIREASPDRGMYKFVDLGGKWLSGAFSVLNRWVDRGIVAS